MFDKIFYRLGIAAQSTPSAPAMLLNTPAAVLADLTKFALAG
jgi:hypothetical protein